MPEPGKQYFYSPQPSGPDPGPGPEPPPRMGLPQSVLDRHGAVVLDPGKAVLLAGQTPPAPTVYRARVLLVPDGARSQPHVLERISRVLAQVGMRLTPPRTGIFQPPDDEPVGRHGHDHDALERLARLARDGVLGHVPRRWVLGPDPDGHKAHLVDAWVALQALRGAADAAARDAGQEEQDFRHAVRQISLEHLLIGSFLIGTGATEGSPVTGGSDVAGPVDSYAYNGGDTRTPVAVCLEAPSRKDAAQCTADYGRRPVVAVLDTGARPHPWLGVDGAAAPFTTSGSVRVCQLIQDVIYWEGQGSAGAGSGPGRPIRYPWDEPVAANPLVGELDEASGHGTFIAGIIRQVAPDADVLAVRIMHSDGVVYEGDLHWALVMLALVPQLQGCYGVPEAIDVLSLSLGHFGESQPEPPGPGLWPVIDELLKAGVAVVAAAGNYSTTRDFYPAAFARAPVPAGQVPLISVGALNPSARSVALFSDGGNWITGWAVGAAMVSTFPPDINGALQPDVSLDDHAETAVPLDRRAALDPDNFRSGFALWSGTSFATPLLAAHIAKNLMRNAVANPGLQLTQGTAVNRALEAVKQL
jgi:Subtilase family